MKKLYFAFLLLMSFQHFVNAQCSDLFFSEYVEGSSNSKAIELYNPTNTSVDLSNYSILIFANGSLTSTTTFLPKGMLSSHSTYVVVNSSADSLLKLLADSLSGGNVLKFNGDDALALLHNSDTLDIIGKVGEQPSAGYWTVDTGKTQDNTLVRKINVNDGETNWAVSSTEWTVYEKNNFTHIGGHSMNSCNITNIISTLKINEIEIYPNPASNNLYIENLPLGATCSVYDILGNKVDYISSASSSVASINIGMLDKGVYLLNIKTSNQQIVKRFVKQ